MSFSADWLSLRFDADLRARDAGLAKQLADALPSRDLRILDLGSGTGANLAALAPVIDRGQHWVLTDNDVGLLDQVLPPVGVSCDRLAVDLAGDLSEVFDPTPDLVTASAFFDLCGPQLIDRVVTETFAARAAFYTVLTYDGREAWSPPHPMDAEVLDAFHADQRSDKGLGKALGPDANAYLADRFSEAGYKVLTASSDWLLDQSQDGELIRALADGSASAVQAALGTATAESWAKDRRNAAKVMIGHQDLLALPG
ncbi:MAG: SAM-dependent methyltransferase [Pseudomonadota bacterium]